MQDKQWFDYLAVQYACFMTVFNAIRVNFCLEGDFIVYVDTGLSLLTFISIILPVGG